MSSSLSVQLFFVAILLALCSLCYAKFCNYQKGRTFLNKDTCTELEHCQNDQFDNITGQCGTGGQCKPGWMGPSCQYGRNIALWKPTYQSTNFSTDMFKSHMAVDGSDGQHILEKSCTHTAVSDLQPTWTVELGAFYAVIYINISNRNSNRWRLNGFKLYGRTKSGEVLLYTDTSHRERDNIVIHSQYTAQYLVDKIKIQSASNSSPMNAKENILTLCEVSVFACRPQRNGVDDCVNFCPESCGNSSYCLPSFPCPEGSNSHQYCKYTTDLALKHDRCRFLEHCSADGLNAFNQYTGHCNLNGGQCEKGWMGANCQFRNLASNPLNTKSAYDGNRQTSIQSHFEHVQLNGNFIVSAINVILVHPRENCMVKITDDRKKMRFSGIVSDGTTYLEGVTMTKYLNITFCRTIGVLEIEVFGGMNIALWKNTTQSSNYASDYTSDKAVDGWDGNHDFGNRTCTHTSVPDDNPTWSVEFDRFYAIMSIHISNRFDNRQRINGFKLYGRNTSKEMVLIYDDAKHTSVRDRIDIWIDSRYTAKFVVDMLQINSIQNGQENILTLCEVSVYACRPLKNGLIDCSNFCHEGCHSKKYCFSPYFVCTEDIHCESPISPPIRNLKITPIKNSYKFKESIAFGCTEGYSLTGDRNVTCGINGLFDIHISPSCKAITCPPPSLPQNSHLTFAGQHNHSLVFRYNEEIQLLCASGFNISHNVKERCGSSGSFIFPDLPTCQRIMCHLPDISHSHNLSINKRGPTVFYGETIEFACETGFNINGASVFSCRLDGRFDIQALPSCSRIQCDLPDVSNMQSNLWVNETRQSLFYGETIEFICKKGYNINGTTVSSCDLDGQFNIHDLPVCTEVQCIVQEIPHLKVFPEHFTYSFNDVISFSCEEGFYISDNITATCNYGNKWKVPNWPGCKGIKCGLPTDFQNRSIILSPNLTEYDYNTVINISCVKGYRLKGESHRTCQFNGDLQLPTCEVESESMSSSSSSDAVIAGSVVGALFMISIPFFVILVIIWRRRSRKPDFTRKSETHSLSNLNELNPKDTSGIQKKNAPKPKPHAVEETSTYYNLNSTDVDKAKKARQDVYYEFSPTSTPSAAAIKVSEFKDYVENKRRHVEYFNEEFKKFFVGLQFPATAATTPGNRAKNKYKNIYPYDDTRVKLKPDKGHSKSDFINASTIHGYGSVKSYIAAQGPLVDTIGDFWWMIWNEGCEKIVMLTNLIEDNRVKCVQYWPDKNTMYAGNLKIEVVDVENFADFTIRTFLLKKSEEERMICQFHFTSWPDKGVPLYASSLVHFHSKVKSTTSQGKGPLVVHCSAGIGRTGTFIALDYLIQQAKESEYVDVFGCVETLRRQRVNMVQTVEQYIFVHSALLEALMCTSSDPSTTEFPQLFNDLMNIDYNTGKRNIDIHFENVLSSLGEIPESAFRFAKDPENKKKNRYSNVLPVDNEMPELRDAENKRVYINAIFLPAYKTRRSFIVTQMPLKDTVDDFWKLLSDQKVSTIVMLNQTEPTKLNNEKNIGMYWPEGSESKQYGVVIVSKESSSSNEKDYTIIDLLFKIKNSEDDNEEERRIRIFKCNFWPDSRTIPASILSFLKLVNAVELHHDRNNTGPVVVHCMNGAEKSGLFCVLQVVLERMKIEQDVAIHSVIQQMRSVRPSIIPNVEQFKFCYDVVMEFMKQYDAYSNFQ